MAPVMPHVKSLARAERALELRAKAWTWQAISDELGFVHREGSRRAVQRLLKMRPFNPEAERASSTESLRMLQYGLHRRFDAAVARHDDATAAVLSRELRNLMAASSLLNGLNAPQRTEVKVTVSTTEENRRALLAKLQQEHPAIAAPVIDAEVVE